MPRGNLDSWASDASKETQKEAQAIDMMEDFERKQRTKLLEQETLTVARRIKQQSQTMMRSDRDCAGVPQPRADSTSAGDEGDDCEEILLVSEDEDSASEREGLVSDELVEELESAAARARTQAARELLRRQQAALNRIEACISIAPEPIRPLVPPPGASSARLAATVSPSERRSKAASEEINKRRHRAERARQLRDQAAEAHFREGQRCLEMECERLQAASFRRREKLELETQGRAAEARRKHKQQARARRELQRERDREVDARHEEFEEKQWQAAVRRLEHSTSLPAITPSAQPHGGDILGLVECSHAVYQDTIQQWQQLEADFDRRSDAGWSKALRKVSQRPSVMALRADDFLATQSPSRRASARRGSQVGKRVVAGGGEQISERHKQSKDKSVLLSDKLSPCCDEKSLVRATSLPGFSSGRGTRSPTSAANPAMTCEVIVETPPPLVLPPLS